MSYKSLRFRLNQIQKAKVPYIIRAGNELGQFSPEDILAYFGGLPEVLTNCGYDFSKRGEQNEQIRAYAKNLAKLVNGKPEDFLHSTGTNFPLNLQGVQTHLIYDPKTDLTHIFVLPSGIDVDFKIPD